MILIHFKFWFLCCFFAVFAVVVVVACLLWFCEGAQAVRALSIPQSTFNKLSADLSNEICMNCKFLSSYVCVRACVCFFLSSLLLTVYYVKTLRNFSFESKYAKKYTQTQTHLRLSESITEIHFDANFSGDKLLQPIKNSTQKRANKYIWFKKKSKRRTSDLLFWTQLMPIQLNMLKNISSLKASTYFASLVPSSRLSVALSLSVALFQFFLLLN